MKERLGTVAILVLGIAIGIIGWNILTLAVPTPLYAEATGGDAQGLIAVTGLCTNSYSGLWVIDARDTDSSPSLCLYIPVNNGANFKLAAARKIKFDLQMVSYNDRTDDKYTPGKLKAIVEQQKKKEQEEAEKAKSKEK
jgi:hypothetical protein